MTFCRIPAILVIAGAFALCIPVVCPAEEITDPGLLRLRAYLDDLDMLRANFRQEVLDRDLEIVEEASGQVILKKPGHFRWNYQHPYERVIVADGERVWLYEADLEQVTVRRLDAGIGKTPAALLTGDTGVLEQFEFIDSSSGKDVDWVRLRPVSAESDFERISLGFDGDRLAQIILDDRLGQQTRIFMSQIERPSELPADTFHFEIPDGVDVIGESEL